MAQTVYFSQDCEATDSLGFEDFDQYRDFAKPHNERRVRIVRLHYELAEEAYKAWARRETQ